MAAPDFLNLAVAVGLGLLVGLQRERAVDEIAGFRTFTLITLLGFLGGFLIGDTGPWLAVAGLLALVALVVVASSLRARGKADFDAGITTEVAALVMYGVGVLLALDHTALALVIGAGAAVLLQWKAPLHAFAERMGQAELDAVFRLALIALVILPVLPDRPYGPYGVLNPFRIWLMVVLIVGISMAGYVAFKLLGSRAGALAAGLLGGLISSTATTVSYARRSAETPDRSRSAALVILLASVVVFGRVLLEILVVSPRLFSAGALPLAAAMAFMGLLAVVLIRRHDADDPVEIQDQAPPSELGAALTFGLLYGAVLLGVAFARERMGQPGLFLVAGLSGLTDMDAITLSTAQLVQGQGLAPETGWRVVMVGAMANLVFKGGIVTVLGHRRLRRRVLTLFALSLAACGAILVAWPG